MTEFASFISNARNIVILTGAGISTESGIPDFRSPGGIWETFRIIQYPEFMNSEAARLEDWRRRFYMEDQIGKVQPNVGHKVIAEWVNDGKCSTVITQNIDGLHQRAGTQNDSIIEIHGSARHANCTACGLRYEITECRAMLEKTDRSPQCTECGGIIKTAVVMFGEQMPQKETELAFEAASQCDLFISIGTSLAVYPAADLPVHAKRNGASLAIINREPTQLDWSADIVVHAGIGDTLKEFLEK